MKFFIAIALIVAVASAGVPRLQQAELEQIVAAINSPSTDPATAVALEAMLNDMLGLAPISVGPAIAEVETITVVEHEPIIISPVPVNPVDSVAISPTPVVTPVAPAPAVESSSSPLVQIIVNVQKAEDVATVSNPEVIAPAPVVIAPTPVVEEVYVPGPVNVVDSVDISPVVEPVQVATPVVVSPVQVAEPIVVSPVQVATPVVVEPVHVGTPVLPTPVQPVLVGTPIITPGHAVNPIESLN